MSSGFSNLAGQIPGALAGYYGGQVKGLQEQERLRQANELRELRRQQIENEKAYRESLIKAKEASEKTRLDIGDQRAAAAAFRDVMGMLGKPETVDWLVNNGLMESTVAYAQGLAEQAGFKGQVPGTVPAPAAAPTPEPALDLQLQTPAVLPQMGVGQPPLPPALFSSPPAAAAPAPAAPQFKRPALVAGREALMGKQAGLAGSRQTEIDTLLPGKTAQQRAKLVDTKAGTGVKKAQAGVLRGEPGRRERMTQVAEKGVGIKGRAQRETARHNVATEANTRRGQDMTAATAEKRLASEEGRAAARLALQKAGGKVDPRRKKAWDNNIRIATSMIAEKNPVTGKIKGLKPAYPKEMVERAISSLVRDAKEANIPLSSLGLGLSDESGPAPASSGVDEARIENIAGMDAATYGNYYKNAPADMKPAILADRQEAIRRGLVKKGR